MKASKPEAEILIEMLNTRLEMKIALEERFEQQPEAEQMRIRWAIKVGMPVEFRMHPAGHWHKIDAAPFITHPREDFEYRITA